MRATYDPVKMQSILASEPENDFGKTFRVLRKNFRHPSHKAVENEKMIPTWRNLAKVWDSILDCTLDNTEHQQTSLNSE